MASGHGRRPPSLSSATRRPPTPEEEREAQELGRVLAVVAEFHDEMHPPLGRGAGDSPFTERVQDAVLTGNLTHLRQIEVELLMDPLHCSEAERAQLDAHLRNGIGMTLAAVERPLLDRIQEIRDRGKIWTLDQFELVDSRAVCLHEQHRTDSEEYRALSALTGEYRKRAAENGYWIP